MPPELDAVVMPALAKAADDRYRDARQFQLALEELLVSQRWVAGSVQISELMETLFADRLEEERRSGNPEPRSDESVSGMPAVPSPPPQEPPPPPRASSRHESPRRNSNTQLSAAEMNWEAPPGEMQQQKPRTGMRSALKPRADSGTLPMGDVSDDQEWEAPEATEVPNRRRTGTEAPRRTNAGNTSVARPSSTSRVDVGRSTGTEAPAVRRTGTRPGVAPEAEVPAPRPSRAAMALNPRNRPVEDDDEDPERTMLPPPPEPEPPRRRTGTAPSPQSNSVRRSTSSHTSMPQAPRRRSSIVEKVEEVEDDDEDSDSTNASQSEPVARARSLPSVKTLLGAVVVLALVGAAVVFRQPLLDTLNSTAIDGQDIFINLESNEPVQVSVKHHERCRSAVPITEMATEPTTSLKQASGAHIQDTIILENKHRGILKEIPLDYGEPNETKTIREEFKMGFFRLTLQPNKKIPGLEIYREGQKLFLFQSGQRYELAEGTHHLELRAPSLRESVPVEIEVKADSRTAEKTVDLAQALQ